MTIKPHKDSYLRESNFIAVSTDDSVKVLDNLGREDRFVVLNCENTQEAKDRTVANLKLWIKQIEELDS